MRFVDLTGQKIGRLTVIKRVENKGKLTMWLCQCDCAEQSMVTVSSSNLLSNGTKSCGCYGREQAQKRMIKHGGCRDRLYRIWTDMKRRCNNPNKSDYQDYGGRGISVCEEWTDKKHGFENFRKWAYENGYKENLTVDRISVDGNYEPTNCRWTTQKEQCNNRRNNHKITYNGKTQTIAQWADETGMQYRTLQKRLSIGWSVAKALTTPVNKPK